MRIIVVEKILDIYFEVYIIEQIFTYFYIIVYYDWTFRKNGTTWYISDTIKKRAF